MENSGDGKMLAGNACSLIGNSALLEMNFHPTISLEETMKSNTVKLNAHL